MIELLVVAAACLVCGYLWGRPGEVPETLRCHARWPYDNIYSSSVARSGGRCVLHVGHDGLHKWSVR